MTRLRQSMMMMMMKVSRIKIPSEKRSGSDNNRSSSAKREGHKKVNRGRNCNTEQRHGLSVTSQTGSKTFLKKNTSRHIRRPSPLHAIRACTSSHGGGKRRERSLYTAVLGETLKTSRANKKATAGSDCRRRSSSPHAAAC